MKIRLFYILIIVLILVGIRTSRNIYSEIFPIEEKVYNEINELLKIDSGIVCILIPQKTYYRIGEKPQVDVLIINRTDSTIYLPNSLDGSSNLTRLPFCDIKILNKEKVGNFIDLNPNPIIESDLQQLRPNDCFNPIRNYKLEIMHFESDSLLFNMPYTQTQLSGPWLPNGLNAKNYLIPKNYNIQFVYSTKDSTLHDWNIHENYTNFNLTKLDSIPRINIKSNIVTLKYRLL